MGVPLDSPGGGGPLGPLSLRVEEAEKWEAYRELKARIDGLSNVTCELRRDIDEELNETETLNTTFRKGVHTLQWGVAKQAKKMLQELIPPGWLISDAGRSARV